MSSKVLLEMNIIILPYAGVPSYYFFIDQGQYLAQSLVVVKKKKKEKIRQVQKDSATEGLSLSSYIY